MTTVNRRGEEPIEKLLRRFRRKVQNEGILSTVRRRRYFVSNGEKKRKQVKRSIRRIKRRERKRKEREARYG
jgi:small subunit ribosomal protein S21